MVRRWKTKDSNLLSPLLGTKFRTTKESPLVGLFLFLRGLFLRTYFSGVYFSGVPLSITRAPVCACARVCAYACAAVRVCAGRRRAVSSDSRACPVLFERIADLAAARLPVNPWNRFYFPPSGRKFASSGRKFATAY